MHEPGGLAQVMHLEFSAPPGEEMEVGSREHSHESEVGRKTTEPSISANGKHNVEFSCALTVESFPHLDSDCSLPHKPDINNWCHILIT